VKPQYTYYSLAIRIAADFGATIAIPALLAAYFGKKFDVLAIALIIAFAITAAMIYKKAKYYAAAYEELNKKSE
jgi:hypothetical protein